MKAVQQRQRLLVHLLVPHRPGHSHAAAGGAGVIDGMALLSGPLRVDAQSQAFAHLFAPGTEVFELMDGVKDDVVGVLQELLKLVLPVGPAEHMDLFAGHFFFPQPGLIETAGLGPRQISRQKGIEIVVGEGFLRQQHLTAGTLRQGGKAPAPFACSRASSMT